MAEPTIAEKVEQWKSVGAELYAGALEGWIRSDASKAVVDIFAKVIGELLGVSYVAMAPIGVGLAKAMANAEDVVAPAFSDFAAAGLNDVFGTNVSGGAFAAARGGGGRAGAGDALGRQLIAQLRGGNGPIAPSEDAAVKYVNAMATIAIEDWFKGWFFEVLSSLVPQLDIGKIEAYGALGDKVSEILGLGRISRRVLAPIVDAAIVTPLEWSVNKTYQPRLLSASETARQVARGRWPIERGAEELARQGYSPDRIEAIWNASRKMFSAADVRAFVAASHWTRDQGLQHLRDQGYDESTALDALRLEGLRRINQLEDAEAAVLVSAYASRAIDRAEFGGLLADAVSSPAERALVTELAELRRSLNVRRLTSSQVEAMVKSGVAAMPDYRASLRRDGYPEDDILLLELQLRWEMDRATNIETARREAREARELEEAERIAAAERRRAEVEAERAAARRGPIGKLEAAAIRGLIPFSRVEEVYAAEYDAETVGLLTELLDAKRADYLAQLARATQTETAARARGLNVSEARDAFLKGLITAGELEQRFRQIGLAPEDAALMTAAAQVTAAERAEALARRRDAGDLAAARRIDLGRFESLVRRGARTLSQYDGLLSDLGFDDVDRAAMAELLQLKISDDAAARAERERAAGQLAERGLSLDQFERAVILGVESIDSYQRFLIDQRFTPDAQIALVALLRERVQEANAARARRAASETGSGGLQLPIASIRRAARLGVISPDVYAARLAEDGYSQDDIAIDMELLLIEIADVQAKRAARELAESDAAAKQLSLAEVERAVKRGLLDLDAYRVRAAQVGYSGTDLEVLVDLLADEVAQLEAARARREAIDGQLRERALSIAQLEAAVKSGLRTIAEYAAELRALGYGADDAELLTELLYLELAGDDGASDGSE